MLLACSPLPAVHNAECSGYNLWLFLTSSTKKGVVSFTRAHLQVVARCSGVIGYIGKGKVERYETRAGARVRWREGVRCLLRVCMVRVFKSEKAVIVQHSVHEERTLCTTDQ